MMGEQASNTGTDKESESTSLEPTPGTKTRVERQIWAFRRYHGIGSEGRITEEWGQQEIADALGVSRQTINRWLNEDQIAGELVKGISRRQRRFLYLLTVSGREEVAREYLRLL